ncbi:ObirOr5-X1 [Ooceraea biroi]|uniref:Odorant receptor n=1 Tax=Ooceraea biroi TaxID=2015173 RepID=A0A3L8E4H2_OOCBI|nr:ObirOr5-X1 [Ooceraea biroi]
MTLLMQEWVIRHLRVYGTYYTIWPLSSEDGKFKTLFCNFLWWFYTVNMISMSFLIPNTILNQESLVDTLKTLPVSAYCLEIIFNLIYCRIRRKEIQKLLFEIEQPHKTWTPREQIIKVKFIRRFYKFCILLWIITVIDLAIFVFSSLISNEMYPINVVYPFPISNNWVYYVTYVDIVIAMQETCVVMLVDLMVTLIMWHAAFQFYLLGMQIRFVDTAEKLRASITEYQNIISYVREINRIFNIIIFKTAMVTFIDAMIFSLLVLNNTEKNIVERVKFFMGSFVSITRLFICCYAAEEITDQAYDVTWQIYTSPCMYGSRIVRQNVYMLIQRCLKPVVINAGRFIPVVSVQFCGNLLYFTFSFFMGLRTLF